MRILNRLIVVMLLFTVHISIAYGEVLTLYNAYKSAQAYDAQLAGAQLSLQSVQASRDMAWSMTLPQVSLQVGRVWAGTKVGPQSLTNGMPVLGGENITGVTVSASQFLVTLSDWSALVQAHRAVNLADLQVKISDEQLLVDIITLYFNAATATVHVKQLEQQKKLLAQQMLAVSENLYLGNSTVYDQQQVATKQELLAAQLLAAKVEKKRQYLKLERRIGQAVTQVHAIQPDIQLPVCSQSLAEVLAQVESGSKSLQAVFLQEKLTRMRKFSHFSEHFPKLVLDMSYKYQNPKGFPVSSNPVVLGATQEQAQLQVMLNVVVPIYLGGRIVSLTRQDNVAIQQAQLTLRDTRDQMKEEVSNLLGQWDSALLQEKALSSAVKNAESAYFSAQVSYKHGVLQLSDVLAAQQQFFAAQYSLLQVRTAILQYYFQLKVLQGDLYEKDILDLQEKLGPIGLIGERITKST